MARLSRIVVPGYPHHVTQRGVRSMDVFHEESDRREYLGMPGEEIARHGVSVLAWCLMTNHAHFVAVPHREDSPAKSFGRAHWRYTRMKKLRRRGPRLPVPGTIQLVCSGRGSPSGGSALCGTESGAGRYGKRTMGLSPVECEISHGDYRARPARHRSNPTGACRGFGSDCCSPLTKVG